MFKLNDRVNVQMGDWKFSSEIVDIAKHGVWVDHPQLKGEDMLFIDLTRPMNKVEVANTEIEVYENQNIREIRKELEKAIKKLDENDDVTVAVKVYDCVDSFEEVFQTYDVEVFLYIDGEYEDGWTNTVIESSIEGDKEALKQAKKRANTVLRSVKGWFKHSDVVTVENGVKVYHA